MLDNIKDTFLKDYMYLGCDDAKRASTSRSLGPIIPYLRFGRDGEIPFDYFICENYTDIYKQVRNVADELGKAKREGYQEENGLITSTDNT